MEWITKMQHSIRFIEENLLEHIDSSIVAKEIGTTQFHYQRLFYIICGVTLADYIRRRRLTIAAQEIASSETSIIDIALKYGYESHASFTKAFTRLHGIAPVYARRKGVKLKVYPPISFNISIKGATSMDYKIRDIRKIRLIGLVRSFTTKENQNTKEIPKLWERIMKDGTCDKIAALADSDGVFKGATLGICMEWKEQDESFNYMIGVENSTAELPDGMEERFIDTQSYAVFNADGPVPDAIQGTWERIFSEWFPATNYEHVEAPEFEVYPPYNDPDSSDVKCDIWIPVKAK